MTNLKLNASFLRAKDLRAKRARLLDAFDILKSNVSFGIIELSEKEHAYIISWYKLVLDLDEYSIKNPPNLIAQYL